MNNRLTHRQWAMELAQVTAKRGTCLRRQVGCILTNKRGHVLSTGYNGVASGLPHCNESQQHMKAFVERMGMSSAWEDHEVAPYQNACAGAESASGTNLDGCQAIHAEQNALLQCKDMYNIHQCFTTVSPCITCTKLLLNTSCQEIIYLEEYPHSEAKELWESAGRVWIQLTEN